MCRYVAGSGSYFVKECFCFSWAPRYIFLDMNQIYQSAECKPSLAEQFCSDGINRFKNTWPIFAILHLFIISGFHGHYDNPKLKTGLIRQIDWQPVKHTLARIRNSFVGYLFIHIQMLFLDSVLWTPKWNIEVFKLYINFIHILS